MEKPKIITIKSKYFVGKKIRTHVNFEATQNLWKSFMPRRKEINEHLNDFLYSIEIYDSPSAYLNFTPNTTFDKWAAIEVREELDPPVDMNFMCMPGGLYAVFTHIGIAAEFHKTIHFILNDWLPNANYTLDDRPHFEIMGEKYLGPTDPNSVEEVWIPIKKEF
ncbi:GyrI-like domain-containing protein [Zhouia sp. PK063]|uniref:GyrI-like domain-containing protein n=1 Tax=Zhouia sp. PK063 TaxID=3373602 RepID=UPI00378D31E9